ncbi:c-type cytochrome [Marinobacterium rhizophilum]|uniref:c-type cytochrome n=1 Tax=Marinobacterium rhizophilum TaxID=420402 RepID=UPI00037D4938|nr:cytochrome c [Marinobacterium rhizophilum]
MHSRILTALALCLTLSLHSAASLAVAPPADNKAASGSSGADAKARVFNNLEASVAQGETRFNQSCVYCHGNRGSGGKAKKLQGRNFDPDYLFKTITKGKRRGALVMPPWEKTFSDQQRWELVTFILSLGN